MARPLSEEKRNSILSSAATVVGTDGVGATTAKIASAAGLAEGTLFNYFGTKDDLLNQLFLWIKNEIRDQVLKGCRLEGEIIDCWRLLWGRYIDWGVDNPAKRKAFRQLGVSAKISDANREISAEAVREVAELLEESVRHGALRDQPPEFILNSIEALAEVTLDFIAREPNRREYYKRLGFEAAWSGISGN